MGIGAIDGVPEYERETCPRNQIGNSACHAGFIQIQWRSLRYIALSIPCREKLLVPTHSFVVVHVQVEEVNFLSRIGEKNIRMVFKKSM